VHIEDQDGAGVAGEEMPAQDEFIQDGLALPVRPKIANGFSTASSCPAARERLDAVIVPSVADAP